MAYKLLSLKIYRVEEQKSLNNLNNLISSYEEHIYKFFNKPFQPDGF